MKTVLIAMMMVISSGILFAAPVNDKVNSYNTSDDNVFTPSEHYPKWSWDTVQTYLMVENNRGVFTDDEVRSIATSSNFVVIEKAHGGKAHGGADIGTKHAAIRLKAINPDIKVLFYFNGALVWPFTTYTNKIRPKLDVPEQIKKALLLFDTKKNEYLVTSHNLYAWDILKPTLRTWWSDTVGDAVHKSGADGVFWDQVHGWSWMRSKKQREEITGATVAMQQMTSKAMGKNKILLCNNAAGNKSYISNCDAVMYEHYGYDKRYRKNLSGYIKDWDQMLAVANAGKINVYMSPMHYAKNGDITFPLACFLIGAQPYSYFMPTYGSPSFSELKKPLGPPLGKYKSDPKNKWIFTRKFKNADVWVDLENEESKIIWSKGTNHGSTVQEDLAKVAALGNLTSAPKMYMDDSSGTLATVNPGEIKAVYFSGLDFAGNATRVYAYIGLPSKASVDSPVPGMVLVHGGGGTASSKWVGIWNKRGYAAISIASGGQTDEKGVSTKYKRHAKSGPSRGSLYNDSPDKITDQWMYHAVADCILANSLLRSQPEVIAEKIGLSGFSWGGIITSTTIGIDNRFMFAIPTYGCGHLYDARNSYGVSLANNKSYCQIWDPMIRIKNATMPVLWFSWPGEMHFPMDSLAYTYHGASGPRMVSLKPKMGHGGNFGSPESYDFADSIVATGSPWATQQSLTFVNNTAKVVFKSNKPLHSASLIYTTGNDEMTRNIKTNLTWIEKPLSAPVEGPSHMWTVTAAVPADTTGWFINAKAKLDDVHKQFTYRGTDKQFRYRGTDLTVSSDYQENITLMAKGLKIEHPVSLDQSTNTVELSYKGPANVEISTISFKDESHPGAFKMMTTVPMVLTNPTPATPLKVQFDNKIAGLIEGQSAAATVTIVWDKLDGSTDQADIIISAKAINQDVKRDTTHLIQNGSFEASNIKGTYSSFGAGNNALNGWTITGVGVTFVNGFDNFGKWEPTVASDGKNYLQLETHSSKGSGTISQIFGTEVGTKYQLSFDYSGIYPSRIAKSKITYKVGETTQSVNLTLSKGQLPWKTETFDFTAIEATTTLSLTGEYLSGFWGVSIDNVKVTKKSPKGVLTSDGVHLNSKGNAFLTDMTGKALGISLQELGDQVHKGGDDLLQTGDIISLWPKTKAGIDTDIAEKTNSPNDRYYNIFNPTIEVVKPSKPNGAALIICPGGGYSHVCVGIEGRNVAALFAESGITCFVLKYRLPKTPGAQFEHPVSLSDAQRAIKYVRFHATQWGLDGKRIGVMGFSAGGHLASMAATLFDKPVYTQGKIASVSCRPDFAVLVYPVINTFTRGVAHGCPQKLLPADQIKSISSELNVTANTPPILLVHAKNDGAVKPQNSILMHEALKAKGVLAELKLYEQGGHGFGIGRKGHDSSNWIAYCKKWIFGRFHQ